MCACLRSAAARRISWRASSPLDGLFQSRSSTLAYFVATSPRYSSSATGTTAVSRWRITLESLTSALNSGLDGSEAAAGAAAPGGLLGLGDVAQFK